MISPVIGALLITWAIAVVDQVEDAGQKASGTSEPRNFVWLNSHALAGALAQKITGLGPEFSRLEPLSAKGGEVLDGLEAAGLPWEELFESPALVASVILAGVPSRTCVVPTEHYFYFEVQYAGVSIVGNVRFSDAETGVLHCGYALRGRPDIARYRALTSADGLCISTVPILRGFQTDVLDEKTGVIVSFLVPDAEMLPFANELPLLDTEQLVSPVIDESGNAFNLLYRRDTCTFLFVLVSSPPSDVLVEHPAEQVWTGSESGFVYVLDDLGRLQLVGIRFEDVQNNSYFDGPFDQVPPRLPIAALIRQAYPGIERFRDDELDDFGNWKSETGLRVAIAPYREYTGGDWASVLHAYRPTDPAGLIPYHPEIIDSSDLDWLGHDLRKKALHWPQGHRLSRSHVEHSGGTQPPVVEQTPRREPDAGR